MLICWALELRGTEIGSLYEALDTDKQTDRPENETEWHALPAQFPL